jgi:hypothetical protein
MRLITLLMFCSFLVGSTHEPPVYKGKALKRDGLYYAPNSTEPLTANVEEYDDSGALNRTFTLNSWQEGRHRTMVARERSASA